VKKGKFLILFNFVVFRAFFYLNFL